VVPHRIDPDALAQGGIPLQMRARLPIEEPVWVEAVANGKSITRRALPYARPGEMVTLNLQPDHADDLRGSDSLTLNITKR
jgi:hypothetical protein